MSALRPQPGDTVTVGISASVQFDGDRTIVLRVVRVDPRPTYEGWGWIDGYVIGANGDAVARREVFVRLAGLRYG